MLWIALTISAAFLQNVRSALQKQMKGRLGTTGATFVRFVYAWPIAGLYLASLTQLLHNPLPDPNAAFAAYCAVGGLAQIVGTALLVSLFDRRSFAVATAFSKTETVQAALFAIVFLGEAISAAAAIGIAISLVGVVAISTARSPGPDGRRAFGGRAVLAGLGSGAAFGLAAVSYRGASLSLGGDGFLVQSATTLFCVLGLQTVVMAAYMAVRMPSELMACFRTWRVAALVGLSGALASMGWFTAMTLQNAALVRAVGQVELIFALASSALFFGEHILRLEIIGVALISLGIIVLVLG